MTYDPFAGTAAALTEWSQSDKIKAQETRIADLEARVRFLIAAQEVTDLEIQHLKEQTK